MFSRLIGDRLAFVALMVAMAVPVFGQTRTWVSGVGDDANPCSRTAPCKTFAGAISKTSAGGEIDALDPGGYGAVTITKSMTLDGNGQIASILVASTNGIVISAASTDVVVLRNIQFMGSGNGLDAIKILNAGRVIIDNCNINGFAGNAISVFATTGSISVSVSNTNITGLGGSSTGIYASGSSSNKVNISADRVHIRNANYGIDAEFGATVLSNSVIAQSTNTALYGNNANTFLTAENSTFTGNNTGVQVNNGATVRVWNNAFFDNGGAFSCATGTLTGTLASGANNRKGNNTGSGLLACAPNSTITVQ